MRCVCACNPAGHQPQQDREEDRAAGDDRGGGHRGTVHGRCGRGYRDRSSGNSPVPASRWHRSGRERRTRRTPAGYRKGTLIHAVPAIR
mgnify:CR=1 FL=1